MHGEQSTWWNETHDDTDENARIAYFSMEFGIEESLPIYSGGLGVLAGDHLKAAAELGVPLVGVGLLYRGGYFTQGIDDDGRQTEEYERVDPAALGLQREDVTVEVELDNETISANVWRKDVGTGVGTTVPLYLLEVEMLTDALYSGDREHRIRQELLLGVGGVRALEALGVDANVFHMNEAGITEEYLLSLGEFGEAEAFGLTPMSLRLSAYANGVSALHGEVAREMWSSLENVDTEIGHVTNGVHLGTWLDPALATLLRWTGVDATAAPDDAGWENATNLDPQKLWDVHHAAKRKLSELTHLDPDRLTIGFARRFATYKRAALVYTDLERLLAMPVQLVVAGKAHPQDNPGKDVMQQIVQLAREHSDRIVFLEDYDIGLAQTIIPGVDI